MVCMVVFLREKARTSFSWVAITLMLSLSPFAIDDVVLSSVSTAWSLGFLPRYCKYIRVSQRVGPAEILDKPSAVIFGGILAAQHSSNLRKRYFDFQLPLLQNLRPDLAGNQVITLNLHVNIFEPGFMRQRKQLASNERIKACLAQAAYYFFNGALQRRILGVVPQQLPIQILNHHRAARPAYSDHFRRSPFLLRQVFKQHSGIHQVEAVRRKRHRMSIALHECQA